MHRAWILLSLTPVLACGASETRRPTSAVDTTRPAPKGFVYPDSRRGDDSDDYHGTSVSDPYRWMEDTGSDETRQWIEQQNKVTFAHLESLPARDRLKQRLESLWNYEKHGIPYKRGDRYFFSFNTGLQAHSTVYWSESVGGERKVLIDPNSFSEDGTVSLGGTSVSEDGSLIAYAIRDGGSDWTEWRVRDVETGEDREDRLKWIKFSGATWTHDNAGFYYSRYPAPEEGEKLTGVNMGQRLFYHRLGTQQSEDQLILEHPDQPKWSYGATVSEDGRYLVISISKGTGPKNLVYYQDLKMAPAKRKTIELFSEFEADYQFLGNRGSVFYFFTDKDAPRGRVITVNTRKKEAKPSEILPQTEDTLSSASLVGGMLVARYMKDAQSVVRVYSLSGAHKRDVELPGIGTANGFGGRMDDKETFYSFTNYTTPPEVRRLDLASGETEVVHSPKVDFESDAYVVRQVFYKSADGTRVPMFLTHKKNIELSGDNPTLLYGYGGFGISLTPRFSPVQAAWLEMGGIYAVANLRGGGEYGEEWHQAGTVLNKQNVFDDFIAAAEFLIEQDYTSSDRLAIKGRSNGGLLVGAAMTQRPDLFGVALPGVGVLDMLRYHKFTIGWAWADDYGTSDDPAQFEALRAYSPVHNVREADYPATLITTGDHDDRVTPAHSFKFAAALQRAHKGADPTLIRIETRAGHGAGKPTMLRIEEAADVLAFTAAHLGMQL